MSTPSPCGSPIHLPNLNFVQGLRTEAIGEPPIGWRRGTPQEAKTASLGPRGRGTAVCLREADLELDAGPEPRSHPVSEELLSGLRTAGDANGAGPAREEVGTSPKTFGRNNENMQRNRAHGIEGLRRKGVFK